MGFFDKLKNRLQSLRGEDNSPTAIRARREEREKTAQAQAAAQAKAQKTAQVAAQVASATTVSQPRSVRYERPDVVPEITPAEVYHKMEAGENLILLDIRMSWDHTAHHPAGAQSMPINELQRRIDELTPTQPYVLSCYHGFTSQDAVAFLLSQGFKDVKSMQGGFSGWAAAALPVAGQYANQNSRSS